MKFYTGTEEPTLIPLKHNDRYYALTDGRILSKKRGGYHSLCPSHGKDGYVRQILSLPTGAKTFYVHRLIATTFLPQVSGAEVNHKNGDKTDNRVQNIEMVSHRQNIIHARRNGAWKVTTVHSRPTTLIHPEKPPATFPSLAEAAEFLGVGAAEMTRAHKLGYKVRGYELVVGSSQPQTKILKR